MQRTSTTLSRHTNALSSMCHALRLLVVLVAGTGVLALGIAGMGTQAPAQATSAPTPASSAPAGDGYSDGRLFHPDATLDTSQIDDLRTDPEGQCLAQRRVMTTDGRCTEGVFLWAEDTDTDTWNALRAAGYERVFDPEVDPEALWVPAELVILGGETGEDVVEVRV